MMDLSILEMIHFTHSCGINQEEDSAPPNEDPP